MPRVLTHVNRRTRLDLAAVFAAYRFSGEKFHTRPPRHLRRGSILRRAIPSPARRLGFQTRSQSSRLLTKWLHTCTYRTLQLSAGLLPRPRNIFISARDGPDAARPARAATNSLCPARRALTRGKTSGSFPFLAMRHVSKRPRHLHVRRRVCAAASRVHPFVIRERKKEFQASVLFPHRPVPRPFSRYSA